MTLIDTHCHIHDKEYDLDPSKTLKRAHDADVKKIIVIGTSDADSRVAKYFAGAHKDVYYSYGIHPGHTVAPATRKDELARERATDGREFEILRREPQSFSADKLVGIGEIGLDYHYQPYDREAQISLFERMLQLSLDLDLPCIFHVREAFPDFWAILDNFNIRRAVVHSFSDAQENLEEALSRGFYIGTNGLATFAPIPLPPLERMLLETDAPYLAPIPFRGKTNQPAFIKNIAEFVSSKLNLSIEEVANITTANATDLFCLS